MRLLSLVSAAAYAVASVTASSVTAASACTQIAAAVSSASDVYYLGSLHYAKDVYHWASSSSQNSACSFEPGTPEDVGIALQIIANTSTPFAVKGGGHASNPGFSSSTGVTIAMYRFSQVTYDASSETAVIGTGLIWDDVYTALEPYNVNVVGGRVTGVGVAGFTLGGGYSWLTNQYGLTIDTVVSYELVMPNGTVTTVTEASNPELFFGLRGGLNNFGIVTSFTLKTVPQGQVWGGLITFTENVLDQVNQATADFQGNNTDPKATLITTYNFLLGEPGVSQILFYDGPSPPTGLFDEFLAIPYLTKDISTRSFLSLVQASPANVTASTRAFFNTVSVTGYPLELVQDVLNETIYYGSTLQWISGVFISYDVEAFLPSLFSHGSNSAYPPDRSQGLLPLNIYYAWELPTADADMHTAIIQSQATLKAKAEALGQNISNAALYNNYAVYDTTIEEIYGDNVPRLQALKAQIDPNNVMGLAGGFKF
ncbi:FAD-binding domain-containing protein [Coniophora puteana RWD-64-598 SS2]|uniref:FAD-binding domain-containing protein n=1 Tax=Coniophora puteana (strain RWD-64-598) TaxID=741705 RepID=A0A5M3MG23_CONPW|nr:FAD-binding domain-containing protein [Coniophora puteana RWD-64-598 SS2]EIW78113.1 FAD-binding domain-containing protein [Coniophora puteana RWD-64-598 SS2]